MTHGLLPLFIAIKCQRTAGFLKKIYKKNKYIYIYNMNKNKSMIVNKLKDDKIIGIKKCNKKHIITFNNMVKKLITLQPSFYYNLIKKNPI